MTSTLKRSALVVGSKVRLTFGGHEVVAVVVEDRGPIGIRGRRLVRVRFDVGDGSEPIEFELPADDVKLAA